MRCTDRFFYNYTNIKDFYENIDYSTNPNVTVLENHIYHVYGVRPKLGSCVPFLIQNYFYEKMH